MVEVFRNAVVDFLNNEKGYWSGPGAFLPELEKMAFLILSIKILG